MWDLGLKEVNKQAVKSLSDCAPPLILARRSLLLSGGLNSKATAHGIKADIFPIGNTDFFPVHY